MEKLSFPWGKMLSIIDRFIKISLCLFFLSCSSIEKRDYIVSEKFSSISDVSVAVLPFDNESVDLDAEKYMREEVIKRLVQYGYSPLTSDSIDEKLKEIGISDAGQLAAFKPKEIASKLSCRILIYGNIENYVFQNLGFIVRKKAELYIKAIDGIDESVIYEGFGSGDDSKVYLNKKDAEAAFIVNTGVKLASNISNKNLLMSEAVRKAVDKALKKFPRR